MTTLHRRWSPSLNAGSRRWGIFFVAWIVLSLIAGVWSFATPIGAAPDEPAHIIKAAAVARGELSGRDSPHGQVVHVPAYIAYTPAQTCYAYNPLATPACAAPPSGDQWKVVTSSTSAGLYNPTYYALVGWPSLIFHDDTGVYAMRIVSGILSSLFLAATVMMICGWRRRVIPLLGFIVTTTPMVFFLNGVINPNSLEVTATLAAFVAVLSIVRDGGRNLVRERAVIAMVAAALAVNTRGISPLWVAIAVLSPFLLATWPEVRRLARITFVRVAVGVIGLSTAAALAWTLLSNSLGTGLVVTPDSVAAPGVGASPLRGFAQIFAGTFDYGQGLIGVFGWLDTPVPSPVFFLWSFFVGAIILSALVTLRGRALALAIGLVGALVLLPPIAQALYITGGGIVWQGRYALALFVCVITGLAESLASRFPHLDPIITRRVVWLVPAAWASTQVYSFAFALKRYGVGVPSTSWKKLLFDPIWAPPGGTIAVLAAAVVVFIAATVLLIGLLKQVAILDRMPPEQAPAKSSGSVSTDPRLSPPSS
ncbi:MAG: DUF2142 domain-containing protein [Kineosporiaceae bacterium]|nr:DUF2142 domain-containing protein [Aeromicrobium sp.]